MQNSYSKMSRETIFNLVNYLLYISWEMGKFPWQKSSLSPANLMWKITGAQMLSECLLSSQCYVSRGKSDNGDL